MKKITVLGSGMVGRAMAIDLCQDYSVSVADFQPRALESLDRFPVQTQITDLSKKKNVQTAIRNADLVIGAVPGFMGFETMKTVIETGKNMVDIAFYNEDPFALNELALKNGVTAIMDCGVAPGISNLILGYYNKRIEVDSFSCLVGGLPFKRTWPYGYKAPFSPKDVLEEYTRPARLVENSRIVIKEALSEPELVDFEPVGTLESFNTDGLRTLLKTMAIPNMKEKTLRYPGHIDIMRVMRETGFLSKEPIEIHGSRISPLDMTTKLLFPKWKLEEGELEFTVMRIVIRGTKKGRPKDILYNLFDRYDSETQTSSMARTTGYACTAAARLVLEERFNRKGICPPEYIGEDEDCFRFMMEYQKVRNINYMMISTNFNK